MPEAVTKPDNRVVDSLGPAFSALTDAMLIFGISVALLIPCFWQENFQAGDLGSHVYNAWLTTQIKSGAVEGLTVVNQWTNVLCDWALEALLPRVGPNWAERIVAGAAMLTFFWAAFSLINVVLGRRPWLFAPTLAMLAYGLVFQLGFMNFYLSTGLSLWMIVLLWRIEKWRALIALPVAALALLAHAAPFAWAVAVLAYIHISRLLSPLGRKLLLGMGVMLLVLIRIFVTYKYPSSWSLEQLTSLFGLSGLTGVEQVWLYGMKYLIVAGGLLFIWVILFLERIDMGGIGSDPLVHIWLLQEVTYLLMPRSIQLPQYEFAFTFIPQRLSLFGALLLCMVVAKARYGRGITRFSALIAAVFFMFLYLDNRAVSAAEGEIANLVETLPPGQRVVAAVGDSGGRLNPLGHMVDRRCVGHCLSYGNYEPPTGQFRVRVTGPNRVQAQTMDLVMEIEEGRHIVTPDEAPLYCICPCENSNHRFCIRALVAGERTCSFSVPITPTLW